MNNTQNGSFFSWKEDAKPYTTLQPCILCRESAGLCKVMQGFCRVSEKKTRYS